MPKKRKRKYEYVKVADRLAVIRQAAGQSRECDNCKRITKNLYWANAQGKPLTMPLCAECYERSVAQLARDATHETEQLSE